LPVFIAIGYLMERLIPEGFTPPSCVEAEHLAEKEPR
jgi:hypothetical protein